MSRSLTFSQSTLSTSNIEAVPSIPEDITIMKLSSNLLVSLDLLAVGAFSTRVDAETSDNASENYRIAEYGNDSDVYADRKYKSANNDGCGEKAGADCCEDDNGNQRCNPGFVCNPSGTCSLCGTCDADGHCHPCCNPNPDSAVALCNPGFVCLPNRMCAYCGNGWDGPNDGQACCKTEPKCLPGSICLAGRCWKSGKLVGQPCINDQCAGSLGLECGFDGTCACTKGFTEVEGGKCAINYCTSNPCKNGGACTSINGSYTCTCEDGYTGESCENTNEPTSGPSEKPSDFPPSSPPSDTPSILPLKTPSVSPVSSSIPSYLSVPTVSSVHSSGPSSSPSVSSVPNASSVPSLGPSSSLSVSSVPSVSSIPSTSPSVGSECGITSVERAAEIRVKVLDVSNEEDLDEPDSPQSKSLKWLSEEDALYLCPDDPHLIQRYVMAVFYFSTNGRTWIQCNSPTDLSDPVSVAAANANCILQVPGNGTDTDAWLTAVSECQWGGVACNADGGLERIKFGGNGLSGTIPRELQELSELRYLSMEEGITSGTIPPELGNLQNLLVIDMNFNFLQGSIPETLYNLTTLTQFDMNDNELTGTISSNIGNWAQLTFLQLENNAFTGTIPAEVGNLDALKVANFEGNNFEGMMPDQVCALFDNGNLQTLTSDCGGDSPKVVCDCCTTCFLMRKTRRFKLSN